MVTFPPCRLVGTPACSSAIWAKASNSLLATSKRSGQDPCFDCWEESGTDVHTSTLACVYGGLSAASVLTGSTTLARKAQEVADIIASSM